MPISDITSMSPSNYSQIFLQIQSPKPMPFLFKFLLFSIVPCILNSLIKFSYLIPSPLSQTTILINYYGKIYPSIFLSIISTIIFTYPPNYVYFKPFDNRFKITCYNLY